MIVKIVFKGKVKGAKHSVVDSIKIHATSIRSAKKMFNIWVKCGIGIKGDSGVFHPGLVYGTITFKSAKEKR